MFASVLCAVVFYATCSPVLITAKSLEKEVSSEATPVSTEATKLQETARQSGDDDDDDDDDDLDLGVDDDDDDDDDTADDDDSDDDDYFESFFDDLLGGERSKFL